MIHMQATFVRSHAGVGAAPPMCPNTCLDQGVDEGAASVKKGPVPFFSHNIFGEKHVLITRIAKGHAMMLVHQLRERHGGHIFTFQNSKP